VPVGDSDVAFMFKFTDRAPEPYLTDGECGVYDE
jgi:hypothetical protein